MSDHPELNDYLAFFEADPEVLNPEVGGSCGTRFVSNRNDEHIVAVIAPDEGEFSLKWWQNKTLRADLNLNGVIGWNLECNSKKEVLFLKFHQSGIGYFSLQLKPAICISWVTEWA